MNRYPNFIDPTCSTFGEEPERLPLYLTLLVAFLCVFVGSHDADALLAALEKTP